MGAWDLLQQGEFNVLKVAFKNEQLSENAKFLCYSLVIGVLLTENYELKNELKNKSKKEQTESVWSFKLKNLIYWYNDILSRQEIIDGYKELKNNNVYVNFDIEDALKWEESNNE